MEINYFIYDIIEIRDYLDEKDITTSWEDITKNSTITYSKNITENLMAVLKKKNNKTFNLTFNYILNHYPWISDLFDQNGNIIILEVSGGNDLFKRTDIVIENFFGNKKI